MKIEYQLPDLEELTKEELESIINSNKLTENQILDLKFKILSKYPVAAIIAAALFYKALKDLKVIK